MKSRALVDNKHGTIEMEDVWFFHNNRKFGFMFTDDDGKKYIISHQRRLHRHGKEYGFHVPVYFVLKRARILFETNHKKGFSNFIWHPEKPARMIYSEPTVFISLNRMEYIEDAVHYVRPRIRT